MLKQYKPERERERERERDYRSLEKMRHAHKRQESIDDVQKFVYIVDSCQKFNNSNL